MNFQQKKLLIVFEQITKVQKKHKKYQSINHLNDLIRNTVRHTILVTQLKFKRRYVIRQKILKFLQNKEQFQYLIFCVR